MNDAFSVWSYILIFGYDGFSGASYNLGCMTDGRNCVTGVGIVSDDKQKSDDSLPVWSVRGVPADIRGAVASHAKKAGVPVGEWLTLAVREKIKSDRNAKKDLTLRGPVSMDEAGRVVEMLQGLAGAGVELPASLQKSAVSMMRKVTLEVSKGQTILPERVTLSESGHTENEDVHG